MAIIRAASKEAALVVKLYDFYEKLYLAELTLRGQIITHFGLSLGMTVAVSSTFVPQVVGFAYAKASCGDILAFSFVAALTLAALCGAWYHLLCAHRYPKYQFLEDAAEYQKYFEKLKDYCGSANPEGEDQKRERESFEELAQQDVLERLVAAASNNRKTNKWRTEHHEENNAWLLASAAGTGICYIFKTLGG